MPRADCFVVGKKEMGIGENRTFLHYVEDKKRLGK